MERDRASVASSPNPFASSPPAIQIIISVSQRSLTPRSDEGQGRGIRDQMESTTHLDQHHNLTARPHDASNSPQPPPQEQWVGRAECESGVEPFRHTRCVKEEKMLQPTRGSIASDGEGKYVKEEARRHQERRTRRVGATCRSRILHASATDNNNIDDEEIAIAQRIPHPTSSQISKKSVRSTWERHRPRKKKHAPSKSKEQKQPREK